ncbi:MAG: hypothetical protein QXX57_00315 [Nitrososphaerota archaeon]
MKQEPDDINASFVPVTEWFPFLGNPIVARDANGNWVGTSVLTVILKPGVNIVKKPNVSYPIERVINYQSTELPYYMKGMLVSPSVWRLNLVAYCNGDWVVPSPVAYYEVG